MQFSRNYRESVLLHASVCTVKWRFLIRCEHNGDREQLIFLAFTGRQIQSILRISHYSWHIVDQAQGHSSLSLNAASNAPVLQDSGITHHYSRTVYIFKEEMIIMFWSLTRPFKTTITQLTFKETSLHLREDSLRLSLSLRLQVKRKANSDIFSFFETRIQLI